MSISLVLVAFLFQMSVGMVATIVLLPPRLVDRLFFKSIIFWAGLFVILSLVLKYPSSLELPTVLTALFGFLELQLWGRLRFGKNPVSRLELILITLVGLGALFVTGVWGGVVSGPQRFLILFNDLSSSLLLGGFLTGMIFGHWYLVNTDMPKKLLVGMAWILVGVLVLRIVAVGSTLIVTQRVIHPQSDFLTALTSFRGHGIFFWERILVGLGIPAIVVGMIWSTARIGSNQSATGIMYVAVAFVFIGELIARYLFLLSGIPL